MARRVGQITSKTEAPEGCFLCAVVSIYQKSSKEEKWWTGDKAKGSQDSLVHGGSEDWLMLFDRTDDTLQLKVMQKLMLVLTESCHVYVAT